MNSVLLKKFGIALTVIGALTACQPVFEDAKNTNAAVEEDSGDTITFGVLAPLSGEAAAYGIPYQHVLEVARGEINTAGGIDGKEVKLVYEDGACEAERANSAVNNLLNIHKVKVVFGGVCSSETLAAAPVTERNQVVLFSSLASSPDITAAGDFVFRNYPSDKAQGEALADNANELELKKVGIITEEQPYTEGIADSFSAVFSGETFNEKFSKDAADFKTQIDKLKALNVDRFFVNAQTPAKAAIIVKQLKELGVQGPLYLNDVAIGSTEEVVAPFAEYLEGSIGAQVPYNDKHAKFTGFSAAYKARTGEDVPYLGYMSPAYDSLFIMKEAIESVGHDPVKIKDYLYTVQGRDGVAGTLSFDENGDPDKSYRHALQKVEGGKAVWVNQ
ncbi:hypothetical protein COV82_02825 [Candidatus Peregrinibacteria bacterium CG11_big_fil_rev_8_21_14_0_20_46_8]|nr:MAG: hypothetical protein COV82_02825 [Candidatus Peregrinibacteria bacterium CG11_big_fil_rev_8_21_14_0_20_46_8]